MLCIRFTAVAMLVLLTCGGVKLAPAEAPAHAASDDPERWLERAVADVAQIRDASPQSEAYATIVAVLAAAGDPARAAANFARAQEAAERVPDERFRVLALIEIARTQRDAGLPSEATATLRQASAAAADPYHHAMIGEAAAAMGEFEMARSSAAKANRFAANVNVALARALARAGNTAEARELAASMPQTAAALAWDAIVSGSVEINDLAATQAARERIDAPYFRVRAAALIAPALAEAGAGTEAESLLADAARDVARVDDPVAKAVAHVKLALAYASMGKPDLSRERVALAERLTNQIPDSHLRSWTLSAVIEPLLVLDDVSAAQAVATAIEDADAAGSAHAQIAMAQVRLGDPAAAHATARLILQESFRIPVLRAVAAARAHAGEIEALEEQVTSTEEAQERVAIRVGAAIGLLPEAKRPRRLLTPFDP